ncbi:MAG: VWA domain-containing protein [Anaerolineales bacterium]|nr:VWA domain-containing protein [Anaerolineales bacterium]
MPGDRDYYALLGVPRNASLEQIRRAYREAALQLHPDRNLKPGETELFLEIGKAYETLIDQERRTAYDDLLAAMETEKAEKACFKCETQQSRSSILKLDEPQVHYLLLKLRTSDHLPEIRPSINLCIVIDRSTSMRGQRMDQVRSAVLTILEDIQENDTASVVAFSDRAEVIVSPDQSSDLATARARLSLLQAGGGTEIGQGLQAGISELERRISPDCVNHLILITDGRTYGDEELCLELASYAHDHAISINSIGIGSDWNDRLLDEIAGRTGGNVVFMTIPTAVTDLLHGIFDALSRVVASNVHLEGAIGQQLDLRSAFRIKPDPMPLGDNLPLSIGNLVRDETIEILLELVVHPIAQTGAISIAHFNLAGDILSSTIDCTDLPISVISEVSDKPDTQPPMGDIVNALNKIAMYRLQEKARHEAELGQVNQAARRLENLATHLLSYGEKELAKAALNEAARLSHSHRLSSEGEKTLKYGTRALLLPSKTGE